MRCDSSEIAPVEYIPAATGKSAATVSTPALPNPFSRAAGGASRRVMATVIAPTKTTHVGNLSHAMTANIAISKISVTQAWSGMFEEPTIPYGFTARSQCRWEWSATRSENHRRKKHTRSVHSHLRVSLNRCSNAPTNPPMSAGEMVFSSTKMTPPCLRPASAQVFSNSGMVRRSEVTSVSRCREASSKQAESSWPRKSPFSHSTSECTTSDRLRRRKLLATPGEMCSSRSSLSISALRATAGSNFGRLWQHALQSPEVDSSVFRQGFLDIFRKHPSIVCGRPDFGLRPPQVSRNRRRVALIAANQQDDLPHRERTALYVSLAPCRRIAKVDESELRSSEALLDQAGARVAGSPAMPVRHTLETLAAFHRQSHA